jgi:hypothetical protein
VKYASERSRKVPSRNDRIHNHRNLSCESGLSDLRKRWLLAAQQNTFTQFFHVLVVMRLLP